MKNERSESNIERIYETDAYQTSFTATVVNLSRDSSGKFLVQLDRTAFFPEGGGQAGDRGKLEEYAVEDVRKIDGAVVHILAPVPVHLEETVKEVFVKGREVHGEVDFALRFLRMQNHLAEHLFCGIANKRFGYDNVGFHLTDVVTFDLNGPLSAEEIAGIETACNEAVWKNPKVNVLFPTPEELESMEFRSKLELEEGVRLVEIEGYDCCACCAPTLHTLGEIGVIKVLDFMPHRGGTRITLIAGETAWKDYVRADSQLKEMMKLFSSSREVTAEYAEEFVRKTNLMHEENTALKKEVAALFTEKVKRLAESGKDRVLFVMKDADEAQIRSIINATVKDYDGIVIGLRGNDKEGYRYVCGRRQASEEYSLKTLAAELKEHFGGRGGGSEVMIQGLVEAKEATIRKYFDEN